MPHIAVFGGTGASGQCIIEEALSRNYTLTILARNPSKLPEHILSSPSITIIQSSLSDHAAISQALDNADAVLSALGPSLNVRTAVNGLTQHDTPLANGYKTILQVMKDKGIKRLIALGTISMEDEDDGHSLVAWSMVSAVWVFLHSAWKDVVEIGKVIQASEGIDWTIARVAKLTNEKRGDVRAGYVGKDKSGIFVARKDLATWFLDELEQSNWIKKMPIVYSK